MVNTCRQLILALVMFAPACVGQTATPTPASSPSPSVPTTKILAVGRMLTAMTDEQKRAIMPREVPATVRLYLDGKIDQWWVREDGQGVVFLMNVGSVESANPPRKAAAGPGEADDVQPDTSWTSEPPSTSAQRFCVCVTAITSLSSAISCCREGWPLLRRHNRFDACRET